MSSRLHWSCLIDITMHREIFAVSNCFYYYYFFLTFTKGSFEIQKKNFPRNKPTEHTILNRQFNNINKFLLINVGKCNNCLIKYCICKAYTGGNLTTVWIFQTLVSFQCSYSRRFNCTQSKNLTVDGNHMSSLFNDHRNSVQEGVWP